MIEVRALGPGDEAAYAAFVRGRPDGLLYHSLPFRDLLIEQTGGGPEYLLAYEGGEIRAALPMMWRDGVLNSLPFFGSHGAVLAAGERARAALLAAWDERATDAGTAAATLVANPFSPPHRDPVHDATDERLNQATALAGIRTEADLLARAEPSAARNLRKARRLDFVVDREPAALGELARVHAENLERIGGMAKDAGFFDGVARHFAPGIEYDVYTARVDGLLAAGLLVFWCGAAAEYYTPAVAHAHRSEQPLAAVVARVMVDAAQRQLDWFNWGGTWLSQDGVRRFKRKWGARGVTYRYFTKLNDRALLAETPSSLRARFGDFYVVPYSLLDRQEVPWRG
jgi:hypothetical protein